MTSFDKCAPCPCPCRSEQYLNAAEQSLKSLQVRAMSRRFIRRPGRLVRPALYRRPRARRRYARFHLGPCSVWPEDVVAQQSSKRGARLADWSNGRRIRWSLQRDPNTEEVDAPLVESGIPPGCLLIAEVVDWTVVPSPPGRRKGSVVGRPWWLTRPPGPLSVPPGGSLEVATL
jgi:hypothetical protein